MKAYTRFNPDLPMPTPPFKGASLCGAVLVVSLALALSACTSNLTFPEDENAAPSTGGRKPNGMTPDKDAGSGVGMGGQAGGTSGSPPLGGTSGIPPLGGTSGIPPRGKPSLGGSGGTGASVGGGTASGGTGAGGDPANGGAGGDAANGGAGGDAANGGAGGASGGSGGAPLPAVVVLFIHGGQAPPDGDKLVQKRIKELGFDAQALSDVAVTTTHLVNAGAVYISESVASEKISAQVLSALRAAPIPVVINEVFVADDLGLVPSSAPDWKGSLEGKWTISDNKHPLAAGLPPQATAIWTGLLSFYYAEGTVNGTVVAKDSTGSWSTLFAFETGQSMNQGVAPARRVVIAFDAAAPLAFTTDGWALFDAAINWTMKK